MLCPPSGGPFPELDWCCRQAVDHENWCIEVPGHQVVARVMDSKGSVVHSANQRWMVCRQMDTRGSCSLAGRK